MEPLSIEDINKLQKENEELREVLSDLFTLFRFGIKIIQTGSKDSAGMEAVKTFTITNPEFEKLKRAVQHLRIKNEEYRLTLKDIKAYCDKNIKYRATAGNINPTAKTRFLMPIIQAFMKFDEKEFE